MLLTLYLPLSENGPPVFGHKEQKTRPWGQGAGLPAVVVDVADGPPVSEPGSTLPFGELLGPLTLPAVARPHRPALRKYPSENGPSVFGQTSSGQRAASRATVGP